MRTTASGDAEPAKRNWFFQCPKCCSQHCGTNLIRRRLGFFIRSACPCKFTSSFEQDRRSERKSCGVDLRKRKQGDKECSAECENDSKVLTTAHVSSEWRAVEIHVPATHVNTRTRRSRTGNGIHLQRVVQEVHPRQCIPYSLTAHPHIQDPAGQPLCTSL